jgi:hypothetical protein
VITLFFYLFAMVLPAMKSYHGYMLPLNLALSYLWLTSLIFSSQDWSGGRCRYSAYSGYTGVVHHHCGLKHTVQAFNIIGLCAPLQISCSARVLTVNSSFLFFNTILEALMWARHRRERVGTTDPEKDRPLTTTTGTTAGAANGGGATTTI